jgi:hypothetical protein
MFTSYATIAEKIFPLVYFQGEFFFVVYFSSLKPLVVFFFYRKCRTSKISAASAGNFFCCYAFCLISSLESPPSNLLRATRKPDVLVLSEIHGKETGCA